MKRKSNENPKSDAMQSNNPSITEELLSDNLSLRHSNSERIMDIDMDQEYQELKGPNGEHGYNMHMETPHRVYTIFKPTSDSHVLHMWTKEREIEAPSGSFKQLSSHGPYQLICYETPSILDKTFSLVLEKKGEYCKPVHFFFRFPEEDFLTRLIFENNIYNKVDAGGPSDIVQASFLMACLLTKANCERETLYNFIKQIPYKKLQANEIVKTVQTLVSDPEIIIQIKRNPDVFFSLVGHFFSWNTIAEIEKFKSMPLDFFRCEQKDDEIIEQLASEKDRKKHILLLTGIQNKIVAELKIADNTMTLQLLLNNSAVQSMHFFIEASKLIQNQATRAVIYNQVAVLILKAVMSQEEKIFYLLELNKKELGLVEILCNINHHLNDSINSEKKYSNGSRLPVDFLNSHIKPDFWIDLKELKFDFYRWLTNPTTDANLVSVIRQSAIKRTLNEYIFTILASREPETVDFFHIIYFEQKFDPQLINHTLEMYIQEYLKIVSIWTTRVRPSKQQSSYFIKTILVPCMFTYEKGSEKIIEYLEKLQNLTSFAWETIYSELDSALAGKAKDLQQGAFKNLFQKAFKKDPIEDIVKKPMKEALAWKTVLTEDFLDALIEKIEEEIKNPEKNWTKIVNKILTRLQEDTKHTEVWKSDVTNKVFIAANLTSYETIRKAVLKSPMDSKPFCLLLKDAKKDSKFTTELKGFLNKVADEIVSRDITFEDCKNVKNYQDNEFNLVIEFLSYTKRRVDFASVFKNYFKECHDFKSKIFTLLYFLGYYQDIDSIKQREHELRIFFQEKLPNMKVSAILKLPEGLEKFTKIATQCSKILVSPFFKHFFNSPDKKSPEDELINACTNAYKEMTLLFTSIAQRLKNEELTMNVIQNYFYKLELSNFAQEIEIILDHIKLDPDAITKLDEALRLYLEHEGRVYLSKAIVNLNSMIKVDAKLKSEADRYLENAENMTDQSHTFRVKNFVESARSIKEELIKIGINDPSKTSPINQTIHETSLCKDLFKFLNPLTPDDFAVLNYFVRDLEENSEINKKSVEDLESVWKFKHEIIDKCLDLPSFVQECIKVVQSERDQKVKPIRDSIHYCVSQKYQLERTYRYMQNKEASFTFRIGDIMRQSIVKIKEAVPCKNLSVLAQQSGDAPAQDSYDTYTLDKLREFRERALLLMNSQVKDSEKDVTILRNFVDIVDSLQVIMDCYESLKERGYTQNFINGQDLEEIQFEIKEGKSQLKEYREKIKQFSRKWKAHIRALYSKSYLFSHFYGKQLRELHDIIFKKNGQIEGAEKNLILWTDTKLAYFKGKIEEKLRSEEMEKVLNGDAFEQVTFLCNFLNEIVPQHQEVNRGLPLVKLVSVSKDNLFIGMVSSTNEKQILKTKLSQILFCRAHTSTQEVLCFLNRAFLNDKKLPFFLIGFEYLTAQVQNSFCEVLEELLKTLKSYRGNVNLVVIGSNTIEKLYTYFYHHKKFRKEIINHIDNEKIYIQTLLKATEKCDIISSKIAGLGKTHYILNQCKALNLDPCFFPIAGNIREERIAERLSQLKITEKTGLILQIHNVVDKKILDEILFQLVFFRSLKSDAFLFFPEQKFHLFIEVQNLLDEDYLTSLRTFKILRESSHIKFLKKAKPQDVDIDKNDLKFHFVLTYIKALNEEQLAVRDIPYKKFEKDFQTKPYELRIDDKTSQSLLEEYFFVPLQNHNPSFIQLRAFIEIFFSGLKTFADSPFVGIEAIDSACKSGGSALKKEMIRIVRTDFVRILMENSRDFIVRTIFSERFADGNRNSIRTFGEYLKDFPLLVMRQGDSDHDFSYSFIYNDIKKVPKELKIYILMQSKARTTAELKTWMSNEAQLNKDFAPEDIHHLPSRSLIAKLRDIVGVNHIKEDPNYAVTLDNFYKMCLIIQRMRSNIPIVIMGETGVGKTALIRYLVENVYQDQLEVFNIHAGINEQKIISKVSQLREKARSLQANKKRLWVFFDEFNTSEEVGLLSEILMTRRFLGEEVEGNMVFLGACNPFRKREEGKRPDRAGIQKTKKVEDNKLLYKVLPPPESLIEVMWDYQELKDDEMLEYIRSILKPNYQANESIQAVARTHKFMQENIEKSSVSLRDVARFKILFNWFFKHMAHKPCPISASGTKKSIIFGIDRSERAFVLTLCFCYYMRLPTAYLRKMYASMVESIMSYKDGYLVEILENEQIDYLNRMNLPEGTAFNLALRENVFSAFVCLMNKIPIIIVGMPGCSKSLAVSLLEANLKGKESSDPFFAKFSKLFMITFQGSESCTSEGVQKVFDKAEKSLSIENEIPAILFDEIGLAEISTHNPLKVLHSHLEVGRATAGFIGISNWELDAAKMGRFLVISRPIPDEVELKDTAEKIFESILTKNKAEQFEKLINTLSTSYAEFITQWRKSITLYPEFFGLRDFYSLVKFVSQKIKDKKIIPANEKEIADILFKGVQRNFDGQANSVKSFFQEVAKKFPALSLGVANEEQQVNAMSIIKEGLADKNPNARALLVIIRGEALIHMTSRELKFEGNKVVTIYGSTYEQDKMNEEYNIRVISDIINYVQEGYLVICKDVNNTIQTSLYDLYNKAYQKVGNKNYCRVAVGANSNPKCMVHPDFNCLVYINEANLAEVDPPFLNRFEKHYLTLDRFLAAEDLAALNKVMDWIDNICLKYFQDAPSLQKDNFIMNSSIEVLASLCLKTSKRLNLNNVEKDEKLDIIVKEVKKELLLNATPDFMLWVESSGLKNKSKNNYDFILECYEQKSKIKFNQLSDLDKFGSKVIVFTYDQLEGNPAISSLKNTKILNMVEMKCETDLKFEIQEYFAGHEDTCVIKMDYDTEIKHLSLLLFLISNMENSVEQSATKNFIIVLHYTRVAAVRSESSILKGISYLNGWPQIFMENLSDNEMYQINELPKTIAGFIEKKTENQKEIVNLEETVKIVFQNSIKRFNFKFIKESEEARFLSSFIRFLLKITNNQQFIDISKKILYQMIQSNPFQDWKKEILNNKEIANRASSMLEAIRLYVAEKVEDLLTIVLKRFFEEEVIMSLFPHSSLKLLETLVDDVSGYLQRKLTTLHYSQELYNTIHHQYLFEGNRILAQQLQKLSKGPSSIEIVLSYPRLFPFSKKDEKCIFVQESDNSSMSLYSYCLQLREAEQSWVLQQQQQNIQGDEEAHEEEKGNIEENNNNGLGRIKIEYNSNVAEFHETYVKKTLLTNNNLLAKLNDKENFVEKEFYLTDIRNSFIERIAKADIQTSNFLDKLILRFLEPIYSIQDYIMVLLRGEPLWKQLMQVYNVIHSNVGNSPLIDNLLFPNVEIHFSTNIGDFLNAQIDLAQAFVKACEEYLSPTKENISALGGIKSYFMIFTNVYFTLVNVQIEFGKFGVTIPVMLMIWKNFMELIELVAPNKTEAIYNDLHEQLIQGEAQGASKFAILDLFLQKYKETKSSENIARISNFQAAVLFRSWIGHCDEQDPEFSELADRLVERINRDSDFPNYCSTLFGSIVPGQNLSDINEICDELSEPFGILQVLNDKARDGNDQDFTNNIAIVLTDYLDKILAEPDVVPTTNEESEASARLVKNFDYFELYYQKILGGQLNNLQTLATMAFFKQYLKSYTTCLLEEGKIYEICSRIDAILSTKSYLADALCIFCLKWLRLAWGSSLALKNFLFDVVKAEWINKFKNKFQDTDEKEFFVPTLPDAPHEKQIQEAWNKLQESSYNNETLFDDVIEITKENHITQYQLMNLFLKNFYAKTPSKLEADNMKILVQKKAPQLAKFFNKYQLELISRYLSQNIEERFLHVSNKTTSEDFNMHNLILNTANWLVSMNKLNSPWTNLFFNNGEVPKDFSRYFNSQFVIAGEDNPYVNNALLILQGCRYNGIYICSGECDYLYMIQNCGWPQAPAQCPFCKGDIGNAKGKSQHTLARKEKGARRIGPDLPVGERKYYCYNSDFQKDTTYWNELENKIKAEIARMKEKTLIKTDSGEMCMTGYNRSTALAQHTEISRIKKLTDYFLRFTLHASFYVFLSMRWVTPEEALHIIKVDNSDGLMSYLKQCMDYELNSLRKLLNCNDSMAWIIGMQQLMPNIVDNCSPGESKSTCRGRNEFEMKVENLLYSNSGNKQIEIIKKFKQVNQVISQELDPILCEQNVSATYKFLKILRLTEDPSLQDMMKIYDQVVKTKYPLLEECLKNLEEIKDVAKLPAIIKFTNEIMKFVDYNMSRDEAKKTKISDFIRQLKSKEISQLLDEFLKSWNNLYLGPIQYQCKILGKRSDYSRDTPVIAFLVDAIDTNNEYGKILAGIISTLSEKQNAILNQIASRAQSLSHLKHIQFFDNNTYLPQMTSSEEILSVTEDIVEQVISATSSPDSSYGNGRIPVYDFDRIQFNLLLKVVGKKKLIEDLALYQNVRFVGEMFGKQGSFSDYISTVRKLGLSSPIPNPQQLKDKFKGIETADPSQFYSVLRKVLGSLEKLIAFFKNLKSENITISEYVHTNHFTAISPLIKDESPIKDYDISCLVSLYEWIEQMMAETSWKVLPSIYKSKLFDETEKKVITELLIKLKQQREEAGATLPTLAEFSTALTRFASRCLLLEEFTPDAYLTDFIYIREDFWSFPYKETAIETLSAEFPRITFNKTHSLHLLIESVMNPHPQEGARTAARPQAREIIPINQQRRNRPATNIFM